MSSDDTYAKRVQQAVRKSSAVRPADAIVLWEFPEPDFQEWQELVGETPLSSYADYLALLASVQADQERMGRQVVRVHFSVQRMRDELAPRGWPNTPEYRAAVVGLLRGASDAVQ